MKAQTPEFLRAVAHSIKIEGGYVDHPLDRGGPTNLGVTFTIFDAWTRQEHGQPASPAQLKALSPQTARQVYCDIFWNAPGLPCQEIAEWWEPMGGFLFDCRINHPPLMAGTTLQRALNIVNRNAKAFPDLAVDGLVGPATISAMKVMDSPTIARGRERLMVACVAYRMRYMLAIAENDASQEEFIAGWLFRAAGFLPEGARETTR